MLDNVASPVVENTFGGARQLDDNYPSPVLSGNLRVQLPQTAQAGLLSQGMQQDAEAVRVDLSEEYGPELGSSNAVKRSRTTMLEGYHNQRGEVENGASAHSQIVRPGRGVIRFIRRDAAPMLSVGTGSQAPESTRQPVSRAPQMAASSVDLKNSDNDKFRIENGQRLFKEIEAENLKAIKKLIAAGADLNVVNKDRCTPLMHAAWHGSPAIVAALIAGGSTLDCVSKQGYTALMLASVSSNMGGRGADHAGVVRLLIDAGAKINIQTPDGNNAILMASSHGEASISVLKEFIEKAKPSEGLAFNNIIVGNNEECMDARDALCYALDAHLNEVDAGGKLRLYLQAGLDTEMELNGDGDTLLMYAIFKSNESACKALIHARADVNAQNNDMETPLMYAAVEESEVFVEMLLNASANRNMVNKDNISALAMAAEAGKTKQVALLCKGASIVAIYNALKACKNMEAQDAKSDNAAAVQALRECRKILLEAGLKQFNDDRSALPENHLKFGHMIQVEATRFAALSPEFDTK